MHAKYWTLRKYALMLSASGLLLQTTCDPGLIVLNQLSNFVFFGVSNLLLPR